MPVAKRVELREMVAALDTCLCGDYRHQHVAEVGACMLCDTPGCGGFRMDQEAVIRWEAR